MFVTQTPTSLREDVWKQLAVRVIGYGITEASDTKRLANIVGDQHMRLYLSTAGPEATGRYPFMIAGGGATGLSFGTKPVFLDMLTDPANFLALNQDWVARQRRTYAHLLPAGDHGGELMAMPERPTQDAYLEGVRHAQGLRSGAANQAAAKRLASGAKSPEGSVRHHPQDARRARRRRVGRTPVLNRVTHPKRDLGTKTQNVGTKTQAAPPCGAGGGVASSKSLP